MEPPREATKVNTAFSWPYPPRSTPPPGNRNAVGNEYIVTTSRRPGAADRIRVQNRTSLKVVEGTIESGNLVRVGL